MYKKVCLDLKTERQILDKPTVPSSDSEGCAQQLHDIEKLLRRAYCTLDTQNRVRFIADIHTIATQRLAELPVAHETSYEYAREPSFDTFSVVKRRVNDYRAKRETARNNTSRWDKKNPQQFNKG